MKYRKTIVRALGRIAAWLWFYSPAIRGRMLRKRMLREVTAAKAAAFIRERHKIELAAARRQANEIISRCSDIDFRRDRGPVFVVTIMFDVRMMSGHATQDELRYIARVVGSDVEAEIASSKFVESANQHDREKEKQRTNRRSGTPPGLN